MKMIFYIALTIIFTAVSFAGVDIEVVYPFADQQIPAVDSTFIFGNVTKNAELIINGYPVPVHRDGGWLAFLPVEAGSFEFEIMAVKDNDTSQMLLPVQIGPVELIDVGGRPLIPNSPYPDSEVTYSVGEIFEFSFKAPPEGVGWFRIKESTPDKMYPVISKGVVLPGNVFGDISSTQDIITNYVTYKGYHELGPNEIGANPVEYWFEPGEGVESRRLSTDSILHVKGRYPQVVGELTGESNIIRTGVKRGYKLLYMPPGVRFVVTGAEKEYYRIRLGNGITGYANVDSVTILPVGTPAPSGLVSFVKVNETDSYVEVSFDTGQKLPYEITESLSSLSMDIDIFGVTGDVDWIRYNNSSSFIKIVKWSQPSDDIFRLSIEFSEIYCGGYEAYYDENRFVLRIKKNPPLKRWPRKALGGVKIAVDPGHSHDSGAKGPTGLKEKDANLWIAHELRKMLLKNGAEVMMTRYGHEHTPLYDRPKAAIEWGADILVSIHNNALPDGINPFTNNGVSVYYYYPHSKSLAESIHSEMVRQTGLPDHGLYYGNLVLTRPMEMPAVLVECAFMMIPEQEALLKTDEYQRKCAKAILNGIKEYLKKTGAR